MNQITINRDTLKRELTGFIKLTGSIAAGKLIEDIQQNRVVGCQYLQQYNNTYCGCIGGLLLYHAGRVTMDKTHPYVADVKNINTQFELAGATAGTAYIESVSYWLQPSDEGYAERRAEIISVIREIVAELSAAYDIVAAAEQVLKEVLV